MQIGGSVVVHPQPNPPGNFGLEMASLVWLQLEAKGVGLLYPFTIW